MQGIVFIIFIALGILYPIIYAFIKKINEKFLFISAAYGAAIIIEVLMMLVLAPLYILDIWFFPALEVLGYTSKFHFIIGFGEQLISGSYIWLFLPIHILVTAGLDRKYDFFKRPHNKARNGMDSTVELPIR